MIVKNRTFACQLIKLQIIYNCIIKFCIGYLHFPSVVNYITDLITLIIFFLILHSLKGHVRKSPEVLCVFLFVIMTVISLVGNKYSILRYIWGARNVFRFYVFFFACIRFMKLEDFEDIIWILKKIFWINIFLIIVQRWGLGYIGDACSGLYSVGNVSGGNGSVNILMCLIISCVISEYMTKQINIKKLLIYIIPTIIVAASIELKIYFIEIIVLLILFVSIEKKSIRVIPLLFCIALILTVGMNYFEKLYPSFSGIFEWNRMIEDNMIYGSEKTVGRLSGMSVMLNKYLNTPFEKLLV